MDRSKLKVVQYLDEAHAAEVALVRVLQSQIAMTPRGRFRSGLESHLTETRDHADRLRTRIKALRGAKSPLLAVVGLTETVVGQTLALGKTPLDLLRGTGGEEKVLKNAKDAAATEALEIATYTALEELATLVGDAETARLAASIRKDEERMLERIMRELPRLTKAVVDADVGGDPSYDPTDTGAADAVRAAAHEVRDAGSAVRRSGERAASKARATVQDRVGALHGDEPWAGYDRQTVPEITAAIVAGDRDLAGRVAEYERRHKDRAGVLGATERRRAA